MGKHTVTEVIDGDTFKVKPKWNWGGTTGEVVRPNHYNTPEKGKPGYSAAKEKLKKLILGKEVTLSKPITLTHGRLLCDVHVGGKALKDYFREYWT